MISKQDFTNKIVVKKVENGVYLTAQTSECLYGQHYKNLTPETINQFVSFYYPLYEHDWVNNNIPF